MFKKYYWIIELIIITATISITLKTINFIGINSKYQLFGAYVFIVFVCMCLLLFAVYKLTKNNEGNNSSLLFYMKKGFFPKDILYVILLVIVGPFTYGLIMEIKHIQIFGTTGISGFMHLTGIESLSMLFLFSLYIPVVVFSEELYFRSYLFNIQYAQFKNYTWIVNGLSWSVYHVFFPTNFVAILPTCLLYSYVYQKRRNIWITIIAHLIVNTIAFRHILKFYISNL